MRNRWYVIFGCGAVVVWLLGSTAWATMDNLKAYKQTYPDKAAKASCKICHEGVMGNKTNLNAYGKALQGRKGAGKALKLAADDYKAAEKEGITPESCAKTAPANATAAPPSAPKK